MIQQILVRILLLPLSALYGLGILLRNSLYNLKLLKSVSFSIPVIGVGNLSIGGAGKTPHVEYLIHLLQPYLSLGTLSRGYKRNTTGFRIVAQKDNALTVGDEPYQYYMKHPSIRVAVSESRSIGIPSMIKFFPQLQVILLDDSFQHRSVTPGLNILLTEFLNPYYRDILLPAGRLREWSSSASRADIIIVTKCPDEVTINMKQEITDHLRPLPHQHVFFSRYKYDHPYNISTGERLQLASFKEIILLCAIANEKYLLNYLNQKLSEVFTMIYEDHHYFTPHDMSILKQQFESIESIEKAIITTEKDATRLLLHLPFIKDSNLPVYVLPVHVEFLEDDGKRFDDLVKSFLLNFKV